MELADPQAAIKQAREAILVLVVSLTLNPLGKVDSQAQKIVSDLIEIWIKKGLTPPEVETLLLWMQKNKISGVELVVLLHSDEGGSESITTLAQYIIDGPARTKQEEEEQEAEAIRKEFFTDDQREFVGTNTQYTYMVFSMHTWARQSLVEADMQDALKTPHARQTIVDGAIAKWGKTARELDAAACALAVSRGDGDGDGDDMEHPLFTILNGLGVEYEQSCRDMREEIIRDLASSMSAKFTDRRAKTDEQLQTTMLRDISTVIGSLYNKSAQSTPLKAFVIMQLCSMNPRISGDLMAYYSHECTIGLDVNYSQQIDIVTEFYKAAVALRSSRKKGDHKASVQPLIGLALTCRFDQLTKLCQDYGFLVSAEASAEAE